MSGFRSPLLLLGAGGHAASCVDVINSGSQYYVFGFVDKVTEVGLTINGHTVVGGEEDLVKLKDSVSSALVAVGQIDRPDKRITLFSRLCSSNFLLPVIVSPFAILSSNCRLGDGSIVMHGAIVNAWAEIGVNCIINSRALVEHGATIGDHCHIATAAVVNGDAIVGDGSFVGSGAVIREGVTVGRRCVIGMGALVRHDLPDGSIYFGDSRNFE